ncbi:hypothetical protein V6K52_00355 [Knoellia sp. S7-12]|uniref:hypothetical protein n=1 Tax=Knoellia sp. S7-12 TaxID=3126698 RepID=UPI0033694B80
MCSRPTDVLERESDGQAQQSTNSAPSIHVMTIVTGSSEPALKYSTPTLLAPFGFVRPVGGVAVAAIER